jgi:hypothetical protein
MDIVMCLGVLHHIDDLYMACRNLHYLTNELLIVECMVIPESLNSHGIEKHLELKDIVYTDEVFNKNNIPYGIMGVKIESSFFDGTTTKNGVVTIPTFSALRLVLESVGFVDVDLIVDEKKFHGKHYTSNSHREMNTVLITARKARKPDEMLEKKIEGSTYRMQYKEIDYILPSDIIVPLSNFTSQNKVLGNHILEIISGFQSDGFIADEDLNHLKENLDDYALNIILGFRFQFNSKVTFEYAKYLMDRSEDDGALEILNDLTYTQNLDWRVCYRTYYLVAAILYKKKKYKESLLNIEKCLITFEGFLPGIDFKLKLINALKA